MAAQDDVWTALGHPARRRILDLIRSTPRTTGELDSELAAANLVSSRFATQRHLQALRDVRLVITTERGRERLNAFNAAALHQATIGWLDPTSRGVAASLDRIRQLATTPEETMTDIRHIHIVQSIDIAATPRRVWKAIVDQTGAWWGAPFLITEGDRTEIVVEARLGGVLRERSGDSEATWGTVTAITPGVSLRFSGAMGMGGAAHGTIDYHLAAVGDGTRVTVEHEAVGALGDEARDSYTWGWGELNDRLRAWVETGERRGVDA